MPYRAKKDRAEAVRRHRERQKNNQLTAEKVAKIDASLGSLLKLTGFQECTFEDFIEASREIEKDDEGVWHRSGNVIYPPNQVFFGLGTVICGNHLNDQVNAFAFLLQAVLDYEDSCES
ncbi:hypothetical protein ACFLVW_05600 [Chloroflexota bacterium]